MGRGVGASTPLLYDLVQRGIDVVYQSQHGRFGFRLVGPASKHSELRVRQVLTFVDPRRALPFGRAVVVGKLHNQSVVLREHAEELGERGVGRGCRGRQPGLAAGPRGQRGSSLLCRLAVAL
jgi:CRISPR/Cas system-associated endonuclease Cas1